MHKLENGCIPRCPLPVIPRQYKVQCPKCRKSYVVLDRSDSMAISRIVCPYCGFYKKTLVDKAVDKLWEKLKDLWPF